VSFAFNPHQGLIIVQAELWGPAGNGILSSGLDTGATSTLVSQSRLMQLGYDPAAVPDRIQMTTGSGVEFVPRITLSKIAGVCLASKTRQAIAARVSAWRVGRKTCERRRRGTLCEPQ
jgi:hypothetical protein